MLIQKFGGTSVADLRGFEACADIIAGHAAEDIGFAKELLYNSRRNITIIDMLPRLADNVGKTSRWSLMKRLRRGELEAAAATLARSPLPSLADGIPPALATIVRRCLEKRPGERF